MSWRLRPACAHPLLRRTASGRPPAVIRPPGNQPCTWEKDPPGTHGKDDVPGTRDLAARTREGDVLVAAVGRARMLGAEHVKPGATVIDVGTNPTEDGTLVGDVDTAAVEPVAKAVTPVPGGVGPVTTALLLRNVVAAAAA